MTTTDSSPCALDSSVIVAGLLPWHVHHLAARAALGRLLASGARARVMLPVPALVESYSVLTRLPPAHRLSPATAFELLERAFSGRATLAQMKASAAWAFLAAQRDARVAGGAVYDAVILACAVGAGAGSLLTFNDRQFRRLAPEEIEIVVPPPLAKR